MNREHNDAENTENTGDNAGDPEDYDPDTHEYRYPCGAAYPAPAYECAGPSAELILLSKR